MTAAKRPRVKARRTERGTVYVPKGSYQHTADLEYREAKERAASNVGRMMRLKLLREGLSARMVADIMGLSLPATRDRLQLKTAWKLDEVAGLAEVFGWKINDIVDPKISMEEWEKAMSQLKEAQRILGWGPEQLRLDVPA